MRLCCKNVMYPDSWYFGSSGAFSISLFYFDGRLFEVSLKMQKHFKVDVHIVDQLFSNTVIFQDPLS